MMNTSDDRCCVSPIDIPKLNNTRSIYCADVVIKLLRKYCIQDGSGSVVAVIIEEDFQSPLI